MLHCVSSRSKVVLEYHTLPGVSFRKDDISTQLTEGRKRVVETVVVRKIEGVLSQGDFM